MNNTSTKSADYRLKNLQHQLDIMQKEKALIRSYYLLNGKEKTKRQLQNLIQKVEELLKERSLSQKSIVEHIQSEIENVINTLQESDIQPLKMSIDCVNRYKELVKKCNANIISKTQSLNQLRKKNGLGELPVKSKPTAINSGKVISSTEFSRAVFDLIEFTGKWKKLIGNPEKNFKMMVYGPTFNGKSTFVIDFAKYLAEKHNMKILFISGEERFGQTLQDKFARMDAFHPNIYITDTINHDFSKYDAVFIDSIVTLKLDAEKLRGLYNEYGDNAFVTVNQCTKDGKFRGSAELGHDPDIKIKVENLTATTEKSRFADKGSSVRVL